MPNLLHFARCKVTVCAGLTASVWQIHISLLLVSYRQDLICWCHSWRGCLVPLGKFGRTLCLLSQMIASSLLPSSLLQIQMTPKPKKPGADDAPQCAVCLLSFPAEGHLTKMESSTFNVRPEEFYYEFYQQLFRG